MGGGKKARGRTNRAKHEEAAAAQKVANSEEASAALREAASARRLPRHPGVTQEPTIIDAYATILTDDLVDFVKRASNNISREAHLWMENELGTGETGIKLAGKGTEREWVNELTSALTAAAEGGDPKAHLSLVLMSVNKGVGSPADSKKWLDNALTQDDPTNIEWYSIRLWYGLQGVWIILGLNDNASPGVEKQSMGYLQTAAELGSATAQHILGMLKLWSSHKSSGLMETSVSLDAGRWIHKAAKQGVKEAQYQLGGMFGCALFEERNYYRLTRKYLRQASAQGHDEATRYMKKLRMCDLCGADDARRTCSLCREVRYCDSACSRKHWYERSVINMAREGGVTSEEPEPHMHACRRTHVQGRRPR
jgi:hypothetical protein